MTVLLETFLPNRLHRGKVRDTYDLGDRLLIVATDRVSAFDVVMREGIPDKGKVLTLLSAFWFERTAAIQPNHFIAVVRETGWPYAEALRELAEPIPDELVDRAMIVLKAERINVECVARGYLAGSGWEQYRETGAVCGVPLPPGLRESEALPEPIFTPTTKAETGHDLPMTFDELVAQVGGALAEQLRDRTLALYRFAADYALQRGIIIADTKFEFGRYRDQLIVIDELLTPDSSRFWPADQYRPGRPQPSFDKQPLRDWLAASGWNREPPPPPLPDEVIAAMAARYREAYRRLTGEEIERVAR
ncbi:MAG: phosphoribosylaminoimidazolesuccinocarboxamide synthase [Chloroflexota bacterium]|nr:phosphoribosylaminoimidazolesuccinocarboxamide synthase [Dehalococcoidia bacterium]MDW8252816.1 phosphoribosylaminoimidazolesuccinocarboxamide synthase [Chloroflexota bacterium]